MEREKLQMKPPQDQAVAESWCSPGERERNFNSHMFLRALSTAALTNASEVKNRHQLWGEPPNTQYQIATTTTAYGYSVRAIPAPDTNP